MVIIDAEKWLHKVRDIEIEYAKELIKNFINYDEIKKASILEIGSGDGYIIEKLSNEYPNFDFLGLEVEGSYYENKSKKVLKYDGDDLNFLNKKFDLVFSLHVAEHIKDLNIHAEKIQSILKPNGIWVNIVPSNTWRIFTTLNYYPALLINFFSLLRRYKKIKNEMNKNDSKFNKGPFYYLIPRRHGEKGNVITEFFYFTITCWSKTFRNICLNNNMLLLQASKIPFFYCSRDLFRNILNVRIRYLLSKVFGGSSIILISKKQSVNF